MKAFVGSANTTAGGLLSNLEMSTEIKDQQVCLDLLHWFEECWKQGTYITDTFLIKYSEKLKSIKKRESSNQADVAGLKKLLKPIIPIKDPNTNEGTIAPFFSPANFEAYTPDSDPEISDFNIAKTVRLEFERLYPLYRMFRSFRLA